MPKYFFNFIDGDGNLAADDDGIDLPSLDEAETAAIKSAREMLSDNIKSTSTKPLAAVIIANEKGDEIKRITARDVLPNTLK